MVPVFYLIEIEIIFIFDIASLIFLISIINKNIFILIIQIRFTAHKAAKALVHDTLHSRGICLL